MFSHARRLSWSSGVIGYQINIEAIAGADVELGVPGGNHLIRLVDVFFEGDERDRDTARAALVDDLGDHAFVDAAAVLGNFEMMNRVAEGTGIGIPPQWIERWRWMVEALDLEEVMKSQQL